MDKEKLKEKYKDEKVICIPKHNYDVKVSHKEYTVRDLYEDITTDGSFRLRYEVETDDSYLQVIPYVVVKCDNEYFVTKRIGGDERLLGRIAFVGGHVDEEDAVPSWLGENVIDVDTTLFNGFDRELTEEIGITLFHINKNNVKCVFYDDRNDVSKCHICLLIVANIYDDAKEDIKVKETDKLIGEWATLDKLQEYCEQGLAENWCEIAVNLLVMENTQCK